MRQVLLPTGERVPALGIGTWRMGEDRRQRAREAAAIAAGLDAGIRLIDTAEMYGEGGAEEIVGEVLADRRDRPGRRDEVFLVSKVYPHNASRAGVVAACDRSLKRLRTDLYLLHWRGSHPLAETVAGFETLRKAGKIRHWGVSNFDAGDMDELAAVPDGGACVANQVLYHLGARGIDYDLIPQCRKRRIPVMAYSPLGQGRILSNAALVAVARKHAVAPAAVAAAWTIRDDGVITIPKSSDVGRLKATLAAAELVLDAEDLAALDHAFPPPRRAEPLGML
jgi:diketogulonate reductase-like aldo/keto reductase